MRSTTQPENATLGLGMTSLALGTIALLLVFLPILGIPISAFGLVFGVIALGATILRGGAMLRWSVAGIGLSAVALVLNVAIASGPSGYFTGWDAPWSWQTVPGRPFVSPPENQER